MKSIKEKQLPELDDEFAKDVSEFDTLKELKADIKKKLTEDMKKAAESKINEQILSKLPEKIKVDLPDAMIASQIENSLRDFSYNLQSQGMNLESYLKFTNSDMSAFKDQMKPRAIEQLKIDLALEEIFKKENLKVEDKDFDKQYKDLSDMYGISVDDIKKALPKEQLQSSLENTKAIDFLRENAKFVKADENKKAEEKSSKTTTKKETAKKTTTKKEPAKKTTKKTTAKKTTKKTEENKKEN